MKRDISGSNHSALTLSKRYMDFSLYAIPHKILLSGTCNRALQMASLILQQRGFQNQFTAIKIAMRQ